MHHSMPKAQRTRHAASHTNSTPIRMQPATQPAPTLACRAKFAVNTRLPPPLLQPLAAPACGIRSQQHHVLSLWWSGSRQSAMGRWGTCAAPHSEGASWPAQALSTHAMPVSCSVPAGLAHSAHSYKSRARARTRARSPRRTNTCTHSAHTQSTHPHTQRTHTEHTSSRAISRTCMHTW